MEILKDFLVEFLNMFESSREVPSTKISYYLRLSGQLIKTFFVVFSV